MSTQISCIRESCIYIFSYPLEQHAFTGILPCDLLDLRGSHSNEDQQRGKDLQALMTPNVRDPRTKFIVGYHGLVHAVSLQDDTFVGLGADLVVFVKKTS